MASQAALKKRSYSWDDYRTWNDGKRWELIDGEAFDMTPAPGISHQAAVSELHRQMANWFTGKVCRVFVAPVDVRLSAENVVQPDIVVVCETSKLKVTHIAGAPTLVVEVLSAATEAHDRLRKMGLYARSGVKEAWLVSPDSRLVEVYVLVGARYQLDGTYSRKDWLKSPTFPKLRVDLRRVFGLLPGWHETPGVVKEGAPAYGPDRGKRTQRSGKKDANMA